MRGRLLVMASLAIALVACRRRPPPDAVAGAVTIDSSALVAPLPAARPEGTWTRTTLAFRGHPFSVTVTYALDRATIAFTGFPPKTAVTVADQPPVVVENGAATVVTDVGEAYGALAIDEAFEPTADAPVEKRLSIRFSNGVVFEEKLPPIPRSDLKAFDLLSGAKEHAIHLSAEPPVTRSILLLHWNAQGRGVAGPAKTLRELTGVAVNDQPDVIRTGRRCSGYGTGADAKSYPLERVEQTWSVIELGTKRVVATRVFRGPDRCPDVATNGHATSYPSDDERRSWLRSLRTVHAKR